MAESKIKEITVFCEQGDSAKISTWSNVPYFLTTTLEEKGIKVNRVNLHPGASIVHKLTYKLWNVFAKGVFHCCTYRRSNLYFRIVERHIRRAVKQYPDSDLHLFTCYNFTTKRYSTKPVVLFNDWTVEYDARFFHGLEVSELPGYEQRFVERQRACIEASDLTVCLFPGIAGYLRSVYRNPNIHYIGNVVNTLYEPDKTRVLSEKSKGMSILFVGKKHYRKGAEELLSAFRRIREQRPDAQLHIIGMTAGKLGTLPEGVTCYGYLDKGNPEDCRTYYRLLSECRLFVNTTPKWGAFSASVEVMYHYTPVIITPYGEFVNTFGKNMDFGLYHDEAEGADGLFRKIEQLLAAPDFESIADRAHRAVASMTWRNFTDRLLEESEKIVLEKI